MYLRDRIEEEHRVWRSKPQLRLLKEDYYSRIRVLLPDGGRVVELGSGCGGFKEFLPGAISTDIHPSPWVDVAAVAERLPFFGDSVDGLVAMDVLHHMERPLVFFQEAARVLKGRSPLILLEPYVSWGSWVTWHHLHHEACSMKEPFGFEGEFKRENNARATLWFQRNRESMQSLIRPLVVESVENLDLFYYPLMGGFRPWSLVPRVLAPVVLRLDRWLGRRLGKRMGYRILVVLRKGHTGRE